MLIWNRDRRRGGSSQHRYTSVSWETTLAVLKVTHYCCEWHEENSSQRKIKTVRCFLFVAHFPPAGPCIVTGQGDRVEAICSPLKEPQTVKSLTRRCECPLLHPLTSRVFMGVIILARFRGSSHFDTQDEW